MLTTLVFFVVALVKASASSSISRSTCKIAPHVNWNILSSSVATAQETAVLGWEIDALCAPGLLQKSFQVQLYHASNGTSLYQSDVIMSTENHGHKLVTKEGSAIVPMSSLEDVIQMQLSVRVKVWFQDDSNTEWSDSVSFVFDPPGLSSSMPFWDTNSSAQFVMMTKELKLSQNTQYHLFIAANPTSQPARFHNSSKLLCSYKLWINGQPISAGPGRNVGGHVNVDYYPLTVSGDSTLLAVELYYLQKMTDVHDDFGGLVVYVLDGHGNVVSDGPSGWYTLDATPIFRPTAKVMGRGDGGRNGAGTGVFFQPHENINGPNYPFEWRSMVNSSWSRAQPRQGGLFSAGVSLKYGPFVQMQNIQAEKITMLSSTIQGTSEGDSYRYVVDFGKNFQGHVNFSFSAGFGGRDVVIRLGEQIQSNGSVKWMAASGNVWCSTWTLPSSKSTFVPHEYAEFRYAEIINAPEKPQLENMMGWRVSYPFENSDNPSSIRLVDDAKDSFLHSSSKTPMLREQGGLTQFQSNDENLNSVWQLAKYTLISGTLDLNTDSNTRQRDVCNLDAWLQTEYQGGIAPTTAQAIRKRVTQFMYELRGYVNYWTEFLVAHVFALDSYTTEYDDAGLAQNVWNSTMVPPMGLPLSKYNYTLSAYYDSTADLVRKTPKPLVDWPRSEQIDTTGPGACNDKCASMNAWAVLAMEAGARLAQNTNDFEYQQMLLKMAGDIRSTAQKTFASTNCQPAGSACYMDDDNTTKLPSTILPLLANLTESAADSLKLVSFLKARNQQRGLPHGLEVSGWMAGLMLKGIYETLAPHGQDVPMDLASQAADYAYSVLVADGTNSWIGMMQQGNATMTMEAWTISPEVGEGGGTMSHPWTASPAAIVPRYLAGIRPIALGLYSWKRVAVYPILPTSGLSTLQIEVPSPQGVVVMNCSLSLSSSKFQMSVTVPGNTAAHICAPKYLFPTASCNMKVNGMSASSSVQGALQCLQEDKIGGSYNIEFLC
eukprot:m.12523 g.12523  ORF g.12523 m.12523 type:complete len:996 (-) comp4664_c0_seq1:95-3082(-)